VVERPVLLSQRLSQVVELLSQLQSQIDMIARADAEYLFWCVSMR
jgi:hypothetical protein